MTDSTPGGEASDAQQRAQTPPSSASAAHGAWTAPAGAPTHAAPPAEPTATAAPAPASAPAGPPPTAAPTYRSWQPGIIALRPLTFGDFLAAPFKAMRFNRAVVLGGPLLFTLIATLLSLTAMWLLFTDSRLGLLDATPALSGINPQTVAMLVVAVISLLLADVLSSSIVAPGVARAVLGERIGLGTAWTQMRKRLGSLVLLYLATTAVYLVLGGVAALPILLGAIAGDPSGVSILLSVLLLFALLVPAGIVVTLLQGVARAMVVLEGITVVAAIRRTLRLIRGRFWWSILIVFVTALLINVVASTLQYVGQFAALAASFVAPQNEALLAIAFFVVYGLAFIVSMVITYSYMGAVFALIYTDLRMRREGFDLDLARAAEARSAQARAAAGR